MTGKLVGPEDEVEFVCEAVRNGWRVTKMRAIPAFVLFYDLRVGHRCFFPDSGHAYGRVMHVPEKIGDVVRREDGKVREVTADVVRNFVSPGPRVAVMAEDKVGDE